MSGPSFYDLGAEEQVLVNLFNGWGYNFYRAENQLRADNLLVRARIGEMLAQARASIDVAESAWRETRLPPPTRERPLPDPEAVRGAKALESLGRALGALQGQVGSLPVPETDRMSQRLRDELQTLDRLLAADRALVAGADRLRRATQVSLPEELLAREAEVRALLAAFSASLQARRELLSAPPNLASPNPASPNSARPELVPPSRCP